MPENQIVLQGPVPDAVSAAFLPLEMLIGAGGAAASPAANHYQRHPLSIAQTGQAIARVLVPEAIELGPNVQLSADGREVVATVCGQVRMSGKRIWVEEVLEIAGDVDFSTGCIEYKQDIIVRGSVLDLFKVTGGGTVRVGRAVEAAEVRAALDLLVAGAIAGKEKGRCFAGRNLKAKHISNATLEAGNDVIAKTEITHSRIICGGRLRVDHGALVASHVTANAGVCCGVLGCTSESETLVEAGMDEFLRRLSLASIPKLQADLKQIEKIQQTVKPLMYNQKSLNPAQKEKATELLCLASDMEEGNRQAIELLQRRSDEAAARSKPEIVVGHSVCAGVTVRFPGLEATIPSPMKGPLRIFPRRVLAEPRIMVSSDDHRKPFALQTRRWSDEAMDALSRVLPGRVSTVAS